MATELVAATLGALHSKRGEGGELGDNFLLAYSNASGGCRARGQQFVGAGARGRGGKWLPVIKTPPRRSL